MHRNSPAELLQGGREGEREPKSHRWIAVIGGVSLGVGYYMAAADKRPTYAISVFFQASVLVMIGTYCLFTAGSIALLKSLKKKKRFYYKTEHFISVSGLLYRMKQNAAGLAGICILSTAVLVMLSGTTALYAGINDISRNRFPRNILLEAEHASQKEKTALAQTVQKVLSQNGLTQKNLLSYSDLSLLVSNGGDGIFNVEPALIAGNGKNVQSMHVMTEEDYNRITGSQAQLAQGQCMVLTQHKPYQAASLSVLGRTYQAMPGGDDGLWEGADTFGSEVYYVILPDDQEMQLLLSGWQEKTGGNAPSIQYHYGFDLDASQDTQLRIYNEIMDQVSAIPGGVQVESAAAERASDRSIYGGLLFLGVFLGVLFVLAAVLIIYYKQVTEGYDDKGRFEIMQKVGLTGGEVRKSIHFQLLLMFFLPLAAAALHITAAFPLITELLSAMYLTNVKLFAAASAGTFAVFAVVYTFVYMLTSRIYLKIVSS